MRIIKDRKYLYNNEIDEEILDPEEADEGFEKDLEDILDPMD